MPLLPGGNAIDHDSSNNSSTNNNRNINSRSNDNSATRIIDNNIQGDSRRGEGLMGGDVEVVLAQHEHGAIHIITTIIMIILLLY